VALRERVHATIDPSIKEDAAHVRVTLADGRVLEQHVEHAIGSLAHPMSDSDLEAKFRGLCKPVLPARQIDALVAQCWQIDEMTDSGSLARMTVPGASVRPA